MKFYPINIGTFLQILDSIAWQNNCTVDAVAQFSGYGKSTVRSAVTNACNIGLTTVVDGSKLSILSDFRPKLPKAQQLAIIRKQLQGWEFFQVVCEFLSSGESFAGAIRKASILAAVPNTTEEAVAPLMALAIETGLMCRKGKAFALSESIPSAPTPEAGILTAQLDNEMSARLFVSDRIGTEIFHSLEKPEQSRLCNAIFCHSSNPEKSCEDAGKALESYLRVVGTNAGYDLTKFNGLGEIADYLAGADRLAIHPKHRDLIKATSTLRNCSAHERDKLTNRPWIKTPEMALAGALWTLHLMRSVAMWRESKEQVL